MNSPLLGAIDARIRKARDPVENACLRAERAALLARQGQLDAARAELRSLRARFDTQPHAVVSAWASLAEGLVAYFEDLNASARDKFRRALALSTAVNAPSIQSVSAAWLAQIEFSGHEFEAMILHVKEALNTAPAALHSARSRASLVVAEAYHWAERVDLALPWYSVVRQHAAAEGDEATLSALMHNMAWLRVAEARRCAVFGEIAESNARQAKLGADSINRFDELVGTTSLSSLVPVLRSQALILNADYEEALHLLDRHVEDASKQGLERMVCVMVADAAWCRLQLGDAVGALRDAGKAEVSVSAETQVDDVAMTNSRLSDIYKSLGDADRATKHSKIASDSWGVHMDRQSRLVRMLTSSFDPPT